MGINNIFTRYDDGQRGWKEYAQYDRILFSATVDEIPEVLFDQLINGGILIAPINHNGSEIITRYYKQGKHITARKLELCSFVPVLDGIKGA